MRVHELAKATGLESKDVLAIAKRHRIAVKPNPSANIEDKDVRKLFPLIEKFKADQKVKEAEDQKRKEEERLRREEERRRKEEERRKAAEDKRKQDEEDRRRKEEEARAEAQRKVEEDRRRKEDEDRARREAEEHQRAEDERLRSLGFRPVRPSPGVVRPAAPQPPPPAPVAATKAPVAPPAPAAAEEKKQEVPAEAAKPEQPARESRVSPEVRPAPRPTPGGPRPTGSQVRPQQGGGYQGRPQQGGGYQGRPQQGGYQGRPQGDRPQGDRGGYQQRQGGYPPRQPGQGYQGRPQGDRPQGDRGGYQQRPGGYPPRQPGQGYQGRPGMGPRPGGQGGPGGPRPYGPGGQRPPYGQRPGGPGGGPGGERRPYRPGGPGQGPGGRPGGPQQGRREDWGRGPRPGGARQEGGRSTEPAVLTEANLPTIEVMRIDKEHHRKGTDKKPRRTTDAKKTPKPSRIFELDEDMTVTSRPKPGPRPGGRGTGVEMRPGRRSRAGQRKRGGGGQSFYAPSGVMPPRQVRVQGQITVAQFAEKTGVPVTELIRKLLVLGEMLNLNQILLPELMEVLAPEFNVELEIIPETDEYDVRNYVGENDESKMRRRPPVVTIMGHVDHGKTTLLDRIRKSNVVEGEFGGITQHIGAYHVETSKGEIVFLDTPGHEAFTSMRARGASVTDLVILVVAANDGFKPQTIEAIHHSQAAKVPLVVAVNKIDLPGADPSRVRQEGLQHGLVSEEFGGDTIFVDISAKHGQNVDQLLEMVALQAEILDLKADPDRPALGTIVESHVDPNRGAVATVLVQKGTLRDGDAFVCGDISGRVRAMVDDRGKPVESAGPSFPVEIIGLTGSPGAGEMFLVMPDERIAREIAERRESRRRLAGLAPTTQKHITLEGLHDFIEEGKVKELNVILKADVQGSIEAVSQSLQKLSATQVRINILHAAVGGINESDVNLAIASEAVIIGFNIRPEASAAELAEREGVDIKLYRIIYDLIEDVRAAMTGMLEPKYREKVIGHVEIRQLFKISRIGTIAGCYVRDGEITRDAKVRLLRDNVVVYEGKLSSLKRFKEDTKRVPVGMECGLSIENYNDIKEGDVLEAYTMEQVEVTLESPPDTTN